MPKPKSKEIINSEDDSSVEGDDVKEEPAQKKAKTSQTASHTSSSQPGGHCWELGRRRKVTINKFKGKVLIDIREFYMADDVEKPGKKGISLSLEEFQTLVKSGKEILEAAQAAS